MVRGRHGQSPALSGRFPTFSTSCQALLVGIWLTRWPILWDQAKMSETFTRPAILYLPTFARAAEATQPHSLHTGRPPNWQGPIGVVRSAETHVVTCEKIHSLGEAGASW